MIPGHDTIVAPATAIGGAIAIVRVSGEDALQLCDALFRGKQRIVDAEGYTVLYGSLMDGEQLLDDVLATVFRAPHSYTGENSVEFSCHGSQYIIQRLLQLLIQHGARMATPGEFTTRAFLAGKMDLSQAEAVADLIASSSRAAHRLATDQMRGGYASALKQLREELLHLISLLELELDFSEEDVEFADREQLRQTMQQLSNTIGRLLHSFTLGNVLKQGVAVAIVGRPNVGKSSLLNRLLNEDRALVSNIPGTTRDLVEATLNIQGVLYRFIDTAGLRNTDDTIEQMGIHRAYRAIEQAQIILQLADANDPTFDTILVTSQQHLLRIVNKIDLQPQLAALLPTDVLAISVRDNTAIDRLLTALQSFIDTTALDHDDPIVSNGRHFEALQQAHLALHNAINGLDTLTADLLAEEIRQVLYHLGIITGQITNDEVLGTIFSKFCIGK
jgi:tRNA modification GTPase